MQKLYDFRLRLPRLLLQRAEFQRYTMGCLCCLLQQSCSHFSKGKCHPIKMDPKKRHHFLAQFFMYFAFFDLRLGQLMPNELKSKPENSAFCYKSIFQLERMWIIPPTGRKLDFQTCIVQCAKGYKG